MSEENAAQLNPLNPNLICANQPLDIQSATLSNTGLKRGPVTKRRFQKGCFITDKNGGMYSKHYVDAVGADGSATTKQVMRFLGNLKQMSERSARREHAQIMEEVNRKRGSLAPVPKGQTFADAVKNWRRAIAPNLSPATVRSMESSLRTHIMPRFQHLTMNEMGVDQIQQFATDLRQVVAGKSAVNILAAMFSVVKYAERCGMKVQKVGFAELQLGTVTTQTAVAFFTREQASQIIHAAKEPFKTLFALAWFTGLRAGEILALTLDDLDFTHKTVRVNKSADDNTRKIRQPKTKASSALLPMSSALEAVLRNYIQHWTPNAGGILFATRNGLRPRSRDNVVKCGLKPVLRQLGIPSANTGLHAFRHGLATELVESNAPLTVLQRQMRHADIATTLRIYTHAIPQSQRDAMEGVTLQSVGSINTVLRFARK
jgi:integrase